MKKIRIPRKCKIQNRYELFDALITGWNNPDYSCIEIYWEILKPMYEKQKCEITITSQGISNSLAPQSEKSYYYTAPTIKRKLIKLQSQGLIVIREAWREKGISDMVPVYYFKILVL